MFAENLRAGWVPDSKKPEYYQVMLSESERLSGVIENVLDFSRIESGHRDFRLNPDDLSRLIADIIERYRYSFETAGIELEADLPAEPVVVRVDREGIAQVLVNLLSNATKYIGEGDKRVEVKLVPLKESVRIEVADTGVGMSSEAVEQIFDPFYRIDDPASRPVTGSGIGLTIVRHIVDAHGGHINVHSTPGRGTTFTVTLPRDAAAPPSRRTTGMEIDAQASGNDPVE
jgi:signal transduction histidine kinase